ncbi:MAG: hypothetical protein JSV96_06240 [Candidatus Aminicenantes bacterium]|nr:MAG: hypothetical protein JSV96_06240 [Candidatus Aminicenantes bacterium]
MRCKVSIVLVLCLLVGFCALPNLAQAQEQKPQLMAIWDIVVHPSKFMEFEAAMKEFVAIYAKLEYPHPWTTYRTVDFHYYLVMPIENYAALDKLFDYFSTVMEKAGKEYEAVMKSFAGTYESETFGTFYLRHDLSYRPENPRITIEDVNFVWWSFFYIIPGMESEAENISHDYQELYKSHGISDGWEIYIGAMWSDLPVLCVAGGAKSEADYHIQNEKNMQKFGDKHMALMKRTMDGTRKFEMKTGTILRELSYTPKKK